MDEDQFGQTEVRLENVQNMLEEQSSAIAALQEQLTRIEDQINRD
jgi:hypothetical protein